MVNITEVTDKPKTVTGTAGQQRSKPTNSNGIYNPYTKQFISLPNDTNHFQLASTHLRNQHASETSHSATHAAWLNDQQYKFHVSNSDEELDAELLKLSVPEPTNEADPKETTLQANEPKEPPAVEPEQENEETVLQVKASAKATAEPNHSTMSKPSEAVLNFQKSLTLLTEQEKQQYYAQVITPFTGRRTTATGIAPPGNYYAQPLQTHQTPFYNQYLNQQYTQASYTNRSDQHFDPLQAIMSQPRLSVFQDFIKDLANAAIVATEVLENKLSATNKMHDPNNENQVPRSIRNKNFTLTTINEFTDHPRFIELKMQAAEICEQYKVNLTATVKELATSEIMWLKILRIQKILPPIQKIIASLIFRFEQTTARPSFPDLVQPNTIQFFLFYWLMQHNNIKTTEGNPNTTSYTNFFGLPSNDIIATAATMLITNSPQAVANVIERLNSQEMDWDQSSEPTGYYVLTIISELEAIINAAVIENIKYQQAIKTAKLAEAQTLAFINKLRTKTATELTNETLNKVAAQSQTDTLNEQDLKRRQQELENTLKKTNELLRVVAKRTEQQDKQQQKNLPGSSSAQRPSQLKPNATKQHATRPGGHPSWTPPVGKTTIIPEASTKLPDKIMQTGPKLPSNDEATKNPARKSNKKRKFNQKRN